MTRVGERLFVICTCLTGIHHVTSLSSVGKVAPQQSTFVVGLRRHPVRRATVTVQTLPWRPGTGPVHQNQRRLSWMAFSASDRESRSGQSIEIEIQRKEVYLKTKEMDMKVTEMDMEATKMSIKALELELQRKRVERTMKEEELLSLVKRGAMYLALPAVCIFSYFLLAGIIVIDPVAAAMYAMMGLFAFVMYQIRSP